MIQFNTPDTGTQQEVDTDIELEAEDIKDLIVYNDEFNSFEFVIDCLVKVCKHNKIQAEQCTMLVHYKGKCGVKRGSFEELESTCVALLDKGLTAKIE